jgi:DNA mismatch repair enzyme (predicted ATPase)
VHAAGGTVQEVRDIARRRGTTVAVSRLFYNAPARQKFLRGPRSEWRSVLETMTTIALNRRDVRLSLSHDGKSSFSLPAANTLRDRVAALWGAAVADRMVDVEDVRGAIQVSGLAERPGDVGTASRRTFITVNGRVVRDNGIIRAAETAYRSTLSAGLRPSLLLEIVVPAATVDVNVHPAKAEVRFADRWVVERAVEEAVRRALGTFDAGAALGVRRWSANGPSWSASLGDVELLRPPAPDSSGLFAELDASAASDDPLEAGRPDGMPPEPEFPPLATVTEPVPPVVVPPLMQLRRTYMMFEHDDGIVLIDQHSAHERVLY